jgi:hypothetical protein
MRRFEMRGCPWKVPGLGGRIGSRTDMWLGNGTEREMGGANRAGGAVQHRRDYEIQIILVSMTTQWPASFFRWMS